MIIVASGIGYVATRNTEQQKAEAFALGKLDQQGEYQAAMLNYRQKETPH